MNSLTEKLNALNGRVKANTSFVDKKKKERRVETPGNIKKLFRKGMA